MESILAPIVLFVYNKPWCTRQALESLSKNVLSNQSKLYIYADGPKKDINSEEFQKLYEVRQIIREKKWCKEVEIIEHEENLGLANSIITGITEILKRFDKIIVIEDDLILSECFLNYMNDALILYQNETKVMHISGYMFPVKEKLPETFFVKSSSCWGWGTWKRAWKYFNPDSIFLYNQIIINNKIEKEFNLNFSYNFSKMLLENSKGNIDSWAIRWYASTFLYGGLCLYPRRSLVRNIGHNSNAVHCKKEWYASIYNNQKISKKISIEKIPIIKSLEAQNAIIHFFNKINSPSFFIKAKEKLYLIFGINK